MSSMDRGGALGLLCVCMIAVSASCASEESDLFAEGGSRSDGGSSNPSDAGGPGEKGGDTSLGGSLSRGGMGNSGEAGKGAESGNMAAGTSGSGTGGAPPNPTGGSGGSAVCDDGNLCTTDSTGADPATGMCSSSPAPDGTPCDDGNACTSEDRCAAGVCNGSSVLVLRNDVERAIPDGLGDCGGIRELASITWTTVEPGQVAALRVELDVVHPYASDLEIVLRHDPSGNEAVILSRPDTPGAELNGTYGFEDGADDFEGFENVEVDPAIFGPEEPLNEIFQGTPVAGTWTLSAGDYCARDDGTLNAVRLTIERTCQ